MIAVRQMTDNGYLGDLTKFGDVVEKPLDYMIRYYRLNSYQKKTVLWIAENALIKFSEYQGLKADDYRSVLLLYRGGFNKITSQVYVMSAIIYPDSDKLTMQVIQVRHIAIGKKGGMRLVNPRRRGTVPHGTNVLIAEPDISILGIRTDFRNNEIE